MIDGHYGWLCVADVCFGAGDFVYYPHLIVCKLELIQEAHLYLWLVYLCLHCGNSVGPLFLIVSTVTRMDLTSLPVYFHFM